MSNDSGRRKRDWVDIIQTIGSIATPLIVAFLGFYLPETVGKAARESQIETAEITARATKANVIPPLIESLLSNEPSRQKLAIRTVLIALPAEGPELIRELKTVARDQSVKRFAEMALQDQRETLVREVYSLEPDLRKKAANNILSGWKRDPVVVELLFERAKEEPNNKNGIYNSVVVIDGMSEKALAPHADSASQFLNEAAKQGPETKALVNKVQPRLRK